MLPQSRYPFRLSRSASSHANQDAEIIQNIIELFQPFSSRMPQKNRCDYPRTLRNSGGVKNLRLR